MTHGVTWDNHCKGSSCMDGCLNPCLWSETGETGQLFTSHLNPNNSRLESENLNEWFLDAMSLHSNLDRKKNQNPT